MPKGRQTKNLKKNMKVFEKQISSKEGLNIIYNTQAISKEGLKVLMKEEEKGKTVKQLMKIMENDLKRK